MDASEVGRFGTLRLMKRLEPDKVVASYPIDDEEITLGRDPICNIRLYYETVSGVHCKIIFRERKAFLVVLGVNGAVVDGCPVYPTVGASLQPVTVPLPNNSSIEIHKKRFQFCYPPKELRATLISTPSRPEDSTPDRRRRRRTLRMSMIQSAQVFTPRPSQNPRENLRILKTPIKSPFMRPEHNRRLSSPLKRGAYIPEEDEEEDEEEEQDIVLVESNHPEVVEEDNDLVILERVVAPQAEPEPPRPVVYPIPQPAQPPAHMQQTPARRRPRPSLHRAVLLKSAHRTMLQKEMEMEEEREAEEVEEIFEEVEQMQDLQQDDESGAANDEDKQPQQTPVTGWRKSLSLVKGWAFGGSPAPQAPQEGNEDEDEHELPEAEFEEGPELGETPTPEPDEEFDEEDAMDVEGEEEPESEPEPEPELAMPPPTTRGPFTVPSRPLGKFMTPQVPRQADFGLSRNKSRGHVRYSVGGFTPGGIYGTATPGPSGMGTASGPRRVRVVEPWRVDEITVPLNDAGEREEEHADEESEAPAVPATPQRVVPSSPSKRERLSEEERKAIIQRRRSALTEPDLFGGQTPGRRLSMFPLLSPTKPTVKSMPIVEESPRVASTSTLHDSTSRPDAEEAEDTLVLLARMKHMVEDAKRRQSIGPRPSIGSGLATPRKSSSFSLLAPDADSAPVKKVFTDVDGAQEEDDDDEEDVSDKENDVAAGVVQPAQTAEEDVDMDDEPAERRAEPSSSRLATQAETPRLDDLRHMFGAQRASAATPSYQGMRQMFTQAAPSHAETPRLDGIRPMFTRAERAAVIADGAQDLHRRGMATPTFEGVGEMLATPEEYQTEEQPEEASGPIADQEPEAEEGDGTTDVPSPSKSARSRKMPSQQKPPATRRTSPRAAATPELAAEPDAMAEAPPARGTRKARGKAAESDAEHTDTDTQPKAPRRTTRRTTPSPAPEEPTRPLRKTRAKTPTPTPEDAPRTGTGRRRARTPIAEVAEEEDPIDSLGAEGRAVSPEVPVAEGDARVRRSGRAKLTLQVKVEEPEEEPAPAPAAKAPAPPRTGVPRAVRGRRPAGAAAATVPRTSSIPRVTARGAKTASLKRPATTGSTRLAAESAGAPVVGNKENTPDPEDEPVAGASGKPTAARTVSRLATRTATRTVGRTRAASVDQPEKPAQAGKSRVSRTKTAKK